MWTIEGELDTVHYGVVPDGAKVRFDASDVEELDWTSELVDGRAQVASAGLSSPGGGWAGCIGREYVWVQGDPDSVVQCEWIEGS